MLNEENILNQITTTNQKTYVFTPSSDLPKGTYSLNITVYDIYGNILTSNIQYTIQITPNNEIFIWLIIIGIIVATIITLLILFKTKYPYKKHEEK